VNSRPGMYSSTSAGCPYFSINIRATSRTPASSSTTLFALIPLLVPSWFGFTMTGYRKARSFSRPVRSTCDSGVSMRPFGGAWPSLSMRLESPLSRQMLSVAESLPVYGTPSSSHRFGTCASRLRPRMPSATLNTTSTLLAISARGKSGVASSGTTV
jgi:hypothetical protein